MKLTENDKIEIYQLRKSGVTFSDLGRQFGVRKEGITYLVNLIDIYGLGIVSRKYRRHFQFFKEDAINRVLIGGESLNSVALDCSLSSACMLHNWIRICKENGYNVLNKKRVRIPMKKDKTICVNKDPIESKIEHLEKDNEYL